MWPGRTKRVCVSVCRWCATTDALHITLWCLHRNRFKCHLADDDSRRAARRFDCDETVFYWTQKKRLIFFRLHSIHGIYFIRVFDFHSILVARQAHGTSIGNAIASYVRQSIRIRKSMHIVSAGCKKPHSAQQFSHFDERQLAQKDEKDSREKNGIFIYSMSQSEMVKKAIGIDSKQTMRICYGRPTFNNEVRNLHGELNFLELFEFRLNKWP